jgi:hypothetical protein
VNDINHLVLSSTIDYSSDLICAELESRGLNYLRINRDRFIEYEIIYALKDDQMIIKMGNLVYTLCASSIESVYFRAPVFLRTTAKAYTVEEQLKRSQWSSFIRNLIIFDKAKWINHPVAVYQAENKLYQLKVAEQCGLLVPNTYVGNTLPKDISLENMYIVKSLDTALFYDGTNEMFTYSTMISGKELLDSEIRTAPIILQDYLQLKVDLRVTIIGNQIFPVSITKNGKAIIGDWRKSNKDNLDYIPIELPEAIYEKIMNFMQKLGLTFGGVDFALVGDDYYFIEINPTGEWGWLNSNDDIRIDMAIVDYMTGGELNETSF